jgi:hypothetical protein
MSRGWALFCRNKCTESSCHSTTSSPRTGPSAWVIKWWHHWMIKSQFLVLLKIWWNMYLWCQVHLSFDLRTAHHFHNHYLYHDHVHVHHLWWSFNGKKHVHYHHDKISRLSISSTRTTRTTSNDRNDRNDPDRSLPLGRRPVTSKRNRFTLW